MPIDDRPFDELLRERLHQASEPSPPAVWETLAPALPQPARRRRAAWWWTLGVLAALLAGYWSSAYLLSSDAPTLAASEPVARIESAPSRLSPKPVKLSPKPVPSPPLTEQQNNNAPRAEALATDQRRANFARSPRAEHPTATSAPQSHFDSPEAIAALTTQVERRTSVDDMRQVAVSADEHQRVSGPASTAASLQEPVVEHAATPLIASVPPFGADVLATLKLAPLKESIPRLELKTPALSGHRSQRWQASLHLSYGYRIATFDKQLRAVYEAARTGVPLASADTNFSGSLAAGQVPNSSHLGLARLSFASPRRLLIGMAITQRQANSSEIVGTNADSDLAANFNDEVYRGHRTSLLAELGYQHQLGRVSPSMRGGAGIARSTFSGNATGLSFAWHGDVAVGLRIANRWTAELGGLFDDKHLYLRTGLSYKL